MFLRMGEIIAQNMLSWLKVLIKLSLLHPVCCLYYYVNDARSHKHQRSKVLLHTFHRIAVLRASESVVDGFEWFVCPWMSPSIRLPSIQNGGANNEMRNSGRSPRLSDLVLHDLCEQDSPDVSVTTVLWRPQFVPWQGSVYLFWLHISPGTLWTCSQELTGALFQQIKRSENVANVVTLLVRDVNAWSYTSASA